MESLRLAGGFKPESSCYPAQELIRAGYDNFNSKPEIVKLWEFFIDLLKNVFNLFNSYSVFVCNLLVCPIIPYFISEHVLLFW